MPANLEYSPERADTLTINMGPSHPATHGVFAAS
jgi:NADH:ubiquinone oxidoreductase subunit D